MRQRLANRGAHVGRMLPDASAEDDGVEAFERRRHRTDPLSRLVAEDSDSQLRVRIRRHHGEKLPHVAGAARDRLEPRLRREHAIEIVGRPSVSAGEQRHDAGIEIP